MMPTVPHHEPLNLSAAELAIPTLGSATVRSPLRMSTISGDGIGNFVPDAARVQAEIVHEPGRTIDPGLGFRERGAREMLFFAPPQTRAAITTCGGLCPGLNNVIRSLFYELQANYGIREVLGIRFGYEGLNPEVGEPPIVLSSDRVQDIHKFGGSVLGTSRGPQDPRVTVDFLQQADIQILFCVGGDGTQRGAHRIAAEIRRRAAPIAVVGIPKTIDNDIRFVSRTFGYLTAIEEAQGILRCAHNEATAVRNGVAVVKLMGREAGFITAGATIASGQVNFTLIPEIPLEMEGEHGLLARLERRLRLRGHAVIVVAEGVGQDLVCEHPDARDASGNRKLGDIGPFLCDRINRYLATKGLGSKVKYFDPSYHIRSVPAKTADALLCEQFAHSAAHAAMAGKTDVLIGLWHSQFVHVPLSLSTGRIKRLSPESPTWMSVLAITGQEKW